MFPSLGDGASIGEGRYELRGVLGEGGMATVYRAWDTRLRVWRAIKVLSPHFADKPSLRRRFETEARTMARLAHRNIAAVHDVGEQDGQVFMVMELVEGGSLADRGRLSPRDAASFVVATLRALEVAHRHGVVHRDIKPHNVLLSADGTPKVTDFGIAHVEENDEPSLTRTGSVMGTFGYMAPEQRAGAKGIDGRADVYAAGATLVALLSGEPPGDLFVAELHGRLLSCVPHELRPVVQRATRYDPADRYASAAEMADALEALLASLDEEAGAADFVVGSATGGETISAASLADEPGEVAPRPLARAGRPAAWLVAAVALPLAIAVAWGASTLLAPDGRPREASVPTEASQPTGVGVQTDAAVPTEAAAPGVEAPVPTEEAPTVPVPLPGSQGPVAPPGRTAAPVARTPVTTTVTGTPPASTPDGSPATTVAAAEPVSTTTVAPARFSLAGGADRVVLVSGAGRFEPGELPPGRYTIEASFGGGAPLPAGSVELAAGESRAIRCDATFMKCR